VKCPNIAYHLVGAKKVQQVLVNKGVVEKYLSENDSALIRKTFTNIYSLENTSEGKETVRKGLENPEKYVLKPQREGGGNNFYGEDVGKKLKELPGEQLSAYILMERICPPPYKNALVRKAAVVEAEVVCELGIYGIFLSKGDNVIINKSGGHLLRTKTADTNEGGVAAGFAVIDSPVLY
jgi:glutathione synthase